MKRLFLFLAPIACIVFSVYTGVASDFNLIPQKEKQCPSCHEFSHPAVKMDLSQLFRPVDRSRTNRSAQAIQRPEGECLLCHNEGNIPYKIIKSAMKISDSADPSPRKKNLPASEMAIIPAGKFIMGEDYVKKAVGPKHTAYLDEYEIDRNDVTNLDYYQFVVKTGRKPPKHWNDKRVLVKKKTHPVTFVSWYDAQAYCEWKGKRLPTEAEWEKAARGTDGRTFPWGNEFVKEYANVYMLGIGDTSPVGQFEGGKSPYGVYDMAGNVFQWTEDWFKPYPNNSIENPNYGETHKVLRGGSFYDCSYYRCGPSFQSFNRIALSPKSVSISIGFRCAKSKPSPSHKT